jgi:hypothetical protein
MRRWFSIALALLLLLSAQPTAAQVYDLSFPRLKVAEGERVSGFDVRIKAARVLTLREIPNGWGFWVDNGENWQTKVTGRVYVGAAAFEPGFLNRLIRIEMGNFNDFKFSAEATIFVTKDFDEGRKIVVRGRDIVLTKR